jgi:hypothetical protein
MPARFPAALALLLVSGSASIVTAQEPVITISTVQSSIAENPNQITRTTTTTTLKTTSTSSATFTVRSDQILRSDLSVRYLVSGTAIEGKDFQDLSGTVTIPAGATTASITVSPINDSEDELDETVIVSIVAPSSFPYTTARPSSASTRIIDDDNVRIIGLEMSPDTVLGGETRDLRITVSGAAPPGGLAVSVASGNTSVFGNAQATIAAGTRVGVARLETKRVPSSVAVPLNVTEPNGSSARDTLVVLKEAAVRNVYFRFWDNFGGSNFNGDINLDVAAPPGGVVVPVTLSVVSPAGTALPVSAPSSVTIAAGLTWAYFDISSQPVNTHTRVEVKATAPAGFSTDTLDIYPYPGVQSFLVSPDPAGSEDSVDVRIVLDQPVGPRLGYNLYLRGAGPVDVGAPRRAWVRYGEQEIALRLGTGSVARPTNATLNASRDQTQSGPWNTSFIVNPPAVRNVYFRFWDNYGGRDFNGDISLDANAPPGGLTVPVSLKVISPAGAPLPVSAPTSVHIDAGRTWSYFDISSQPVNTLTRVEVRASTSSGASTDTLEIYPIPQVQSLDVSPNPATPSDFVDIKVVLDQIVGPRFGHSVYLSGSGPVDLSPFTRVSIQKGFREATLRVGTNAVTAPTAATVNASLDQVSAGPWNTSFTVAPLAPLPAVSVVAFNNAQVVGGTSVPVTLVLTGAVPAGRSLDVSLSASDPVLQPNPSTITIPEGQATATVTVQTRTVTQQTLGALRADVAGGGFVIGNVTVMPQPITLAGFSLNESQVVGGSSATPVTGTVRLSGPAPQGGVVVNMNSSHPQSVLVPATVDVPAGTTSRSFAITTLVVPMAIDATVTATYGTLNMPEMLRVEPAAPGLTALSFNPNAVSAGSTTTGRIELSRPATTTVTIQLASSNGGAAAVPGSVTIPAGQSSATFQVAGGNVFAPTSVQVTATLGAAQASASLTVRPPVTVTGLAAEPVSVIGGGEMVLTVTLSRPADPGGMTVTVSSNASGVIPVSTVQLAAGQSSGTVTVRTTAVGTGSQIRLTTGPSATTTDVRVLPLPLDRIQSPGSIRAGDEVDFEVRLAGPAPAGGLRVPISADLPNVIPLPAFVDIPAGATSATVTTRVRPITTNQDVTVSAGVAPGTVSRGVRVRS